MEQTSKKTDISLREEEVLSFWNKEHVFEKSVEKDAPLGEYRFVDGPPFATGTPHYGHLLQSAIKDAIPRYFTMKGYSVKRQWGWDCHGLPIENIVEKELGTNQKKDIEAMGVKKFNDVCREKIFTYVDIWNQFIPRFGRWADMENPYRTMDTAYMESEWWAFKTLYDKGLIYEDYRTMHVCPRCETTLAQSEVAEGYKVIKDLAVTCEFPTKNDPNIVFLAWTTTPWTLPGNVALAVGESISYAYVSAEGNSKTYIVAESRVPHVFKDSSYTILKTVQGSDLVGIEYVPPFNSYRTNENFLKNPNSSSAWKVYTAGFITDDSGTGIAHEAPAYGAEDMELAQRVGLPLIVHVGMDGKIAPEVAELSGLSVKPHDDVQSTDVAVIKYLAGKGLLFAKEKYEHSYPHCWRCDTPLINYATSSWFVAVQKMKHALLDSAEHIAWSPSHVKYGRWGEWLKGARDWSISRQRFWANTIPVWRCSACKKDEVHGSIESLHKASGVLVSDLHKDVVDEVSYLCLCGGTMTRVPDVLDTWFNSGSAPFATHHYPFDESDPSRIVPVDFIGEAQDQVSKWFYYQHVLGVGLFNSHVFKHVVTTGIVLAEDGKKMSKRLKNYPDPTFVIDTYGADSMRLYILSAPVVRAENLNFSESGVAELSRKVIGRLVNVYEFYALFKDTVEHEATSKASHVLDQWIIAKTHQMHATITAGYEALELDVATRPLIEFVDDLSTWYVRRSRDRIKDGGADAAEALAVLRWVLKEYARCAAPAMPFIADWLWHRVREEKDSQSVHLESWTSPVATLDNSVLEAMEKTRAIVTVGLELRTASKHKVRQPLASCTINPARFSVEEKYMDALLEIVKDELNVKTVFVKDIGDVPATLDTTLSPALEAEGDFRELLRAIQGERKNKSLNPQEKIELMVSDGAGILLQQFAEEVRKIANVQKITYVDGGSVSVVTKVGVVFFDINIL